MSRKILFVDRDGCLIEEPADQQIDSYEKLALLPGVIAALQRVVAAGYELVMVTNQDGLGTASFPEADFNGPQDLLLRILASQGIGFREVLIDRSLPHEGKDTRKPGVGMLRHYLGDDGWSRSASAMVGDRETDLQFAANLGVRGFRVGPSGVDWAAVAHQLARRAADGHGGAQHEGNPHCRQRGSGSRGRADSRAPASVSSTTCSSRSASTAASRCSCSAMAILHIDEHHTVEDCALALGDGAAQALGDKRGIGRYGFIAADGRGRRRRCAHGSVRPRLFRVRGQFPRERVGELPTELVPHFFRSLCEASARTCT